MDPQARCTPPDKVFREGFEYYFFFDGAFFDQAYFQTLQQMLADLGEKAFAIKGAGAFQGYDKTYSVPCSWQEYTGELGESFILTVQPLNFYLCGERDDWGIVVTTDFDMAIIGCKGDASPVISSYAEGDAEDARKWLFRLSSESFVRKKYQVGQAKRKFPSVVEPTSLARPSGGVSVWGAWCESVLPPSRAAVYPGS